MKKFHKGTETGVSLSYKEKDIALELSIYLFLELPIEGNAFHAELIPHPEADVIMTTDIMELFFCF